jgi:transcriptional regulator of acetoin/glycerol metabolism
VPVSAAHLSDPPPSLNGKVAAAREKIEKEEPIKALRSTGGNKAKAARMLNIDRATMYAKLKQHPPP